MKIKIQKLCFRLSAYFAVFSIVLVLVLPAGAVSNGVIDYNDYVYKVEVVGDEDLVYVRIPASFSRVRLYDRDNNYSYEFVGESSQSYTIPFEPNTDYRLEIGIFGNRDQNNGLDLSLIPPGTKIISGMGFTFDGNVPSADWGGMTIARPAVFYHYYAEGGTKYIDYNTQYPDYSTENGYDNLYCVDSYTVRNVDNASRMTISYFWQPIEWIADPVPTGIVVQDTTLVFTISSLLRQQQLTGKTNKLLEEVSAQLAEQGKTLDQYYNGDYDPIIPEDSDSVNEIGQLEDDLKEAVGDLQTQYSSILNGFYGYFQDLGPALRATSWILSLFAEVDFFSVFIHISLSLGLTGTVLGVINLVISRSHAENAKSKEARKK